MPTDVATVQKLARGPKSALTHAPETRRLLEGISTRRSREMVEALTRLVDAAEPLVDAMPRDHRWSAARSVLDAACTALARIGTREAAGFVVARLGRDHGQAAATYLTIARDPAGAYDRLAPHWFDPSGAPTAVLRHTLDTLAHGTTTLEGPTRRARSEQGWADADPRWLALVDRLLDTDEGTVRFAALKALVGFHGEAAAQRVVAQIGRVDLETLAEPLRALVHLRAEARERLRSVRADCIAAGGDETDEASGESPLQLLDRLVAEL